jgi:gas vesicle protein
MKTNHESGVTYLVIGLGLGLLAGLLWAPRRGHEMREELRRGAGSGLGYLNEEADKLRAEAGHWLTKVRNRFRARGDAAAEFRE